MKKNACHVAYGKLRYALIQAGASSMVSQCIGQLNRGKNAKILNVVQA